MRLFFRRKKMASPIRAPSTAAAAIAMPAIAPLDNPGLEAGCVTAVVCDGARDVGEFLVLLADVGVLDNAAVEWLLVLVVVAKSVLSLASKATVMG